MDVAIRSLHHIGAAAWTGGLVFLGIAAAVARRTIPPAERIAVAAAAIAATGIDMATDRLASWSALLDTADGRILFAKIVLFALALAEAAVHSLVLGPRLGRLRQALLDAPDDAALQASLRRTAAISGAVSALVLLQTLAILVLAADLVS